MADSHGEIHTVKRTTQMQLNETHECVEMQLHLSVLADSHGEIHTVKRTTQMQLNETHECVEMQLHLSVCG